MKILKISLLVIFFCLYLCLPYLEAQQVTLDQLKKQVAFIGKLDFKEEVPVQYLNRQQLKEYIEGVVEREYPKEMAEREALFIRLMGFVTRPIDLKAARQKIMVDNAGGLYNEKSNELLVLEEYRELNMIHALIIAHELRHAIQDQHVDLSRFLGASPDFDDRKLARLAALEGDATLVMAQFSRKFSAIPLRPELLSSYNSDTLLSYSPLANTAQLHRSPAIVKYQLMMPYIEGLKFMNFIFKKRKWSGVNGVLSRPPTSSEQILHPGKYLKNEQPVEVVIHHKPAGYRLYHSGVVGEYLLNILLLQEGQYVDHAAGWGGDSFALYREGERYFLLWESVWDKERYLGHFFFAFKAFLERTFKVNFRRGRRGDWEFLAGQSDFGYFFLQRHGSDIFFVRTNDRKGINEFISGGLYD
jgi:hypothetical protein